MRGRAEMPVFAALVSVLLLGCGGEASVTPIVGTLTAPLIAPPTVVPTTAATMSIPTPTVAPTAVATATLAPMSPPSSAFAPTIPPAPSLPATLPPTFDCGTRGRCSGNHLFVAQFFAAAMNDDILSPFLAANSPVPKQGRDLAAYLALPAPITGVRTRCSVQGGSPSFSGTQWQYVVYATLITASGDTYVGVLMDASGPQLRIRDTKPPSRVPLPGTGGPC